MLLQTALLAVILAGEPVTSLGPSQPQSSSDEIAVTPGTFIEIADFRLSYPEPANLDVPIAALDKARQLFKTKALNGASSRVVLLMPDGSTAYGSDQYFSGQPLRLREIRGGYEAIAVAPTVCMRNFKDPWKCSKTEFEVDLREVERNAIVAWDKSEFPCESGTCTVYRIKQADTIDQDGGKRISSAPDSNYYLLELFVEQDGNPLMFSEQRIADGVLAEPHASFIYDFHTPVAPFDLPSTP